MIPEQKKCKHCGEVKSSSEYNRAGKGAWLQPYCKPCDSLRKKKHYDKNRDRLMKKSKEYYLKNRKLVPLEKKIENRKRCNEILVINAKKYRELNKLTPEEKKIRKIINNKKYREKNKDILKEKKKEYYNKNREIVNKKIVERNRNNIELRIKKNLRSRIRFALLSKNSHKLFATINYLGCDIEYFKKYLESKFKDGMSWDNYGKYGWHIDHIIPCANFNLKDESEQKRCFHYTNMQPLWGIENWKKGAKI